MCWGVHAVFQRPRTAQSHPGHRISPSLLRDLAITRPNPGWCTDVTDIPLQRGFLSLVAVMDWPRRTVLEGSGPPKTFKSDQGSHFTSVDFTDVLTEAGIRISMDGTGRWMDNVLIERLWRSFTYEWRVPVRVHHWLCSGITASSDYGAASAAR